MISHEKRGAHRVPLRDSYAHCHGESSVGVYSIQDLSRSGALLRGGVSLDVGTEVEVFLFLPNKAAATATGTVRRKRRHSQTRIDVAVEFEELTAADERTLVESIATEIEQSEEPVVLVCNASDWESRPLVRCLDEAGFTVIRTRSPLDSLDRLSDPSLPVHAVVFGSRIGISQPLDFARMLAQRYPGVRRIFVARPGWKTRRAASGLTHAVLRRPWQPEQLAEAVAKN